MGDREAAVGVTVLSDRSASEGEAKSWGPAVLDAVVAAPSAWEFREPGPSHLSSWREVRFRFPTCLDPGQDAYGLPPQGGSKKGPHMPSQRSAIAALKKLEADREALDQRQRELEEKAAIELGQMLLGTGIETFSKKGIRKAGELLGKLGEEEGLRRLEAARPAPAREPQTSAG